METRTQTKTPFELKGGLFPLTAIQITDTNLSQLEEALLQKIAQAPNFFKNAPLVIDLQKIKNNPEEINFINIIDIFKKHCLFPIGVRGANEAQYKAALDVGLPALPEDKTAAKNQIEASDKLKKAAAKTEPVLKQLSETISPQNKLITTPVRSGQQVFAPMGDIIIMNHVSEGAELLAHGNIHVYGSLRGRALGGIHGDSNAKIFCKSLEAELISIAGNYLVSEDLNASTHWNKSVVCALSADKLIITDI